MVVNSLFRPYQGEAVAMGEMERKGRTPSEQHFRSCRQLYEQAVEDTEEFLGKEAKPGLETYLMEQKEGKRDDLTRGFFSVRNDGGHVITLLPGQEHKKWEEKLKSTVSHEYSHSVYFLEAEDDEEIYRKLLYRPDNLEKILAEGYAVTRAEKVKEINRYSVENSFSNPEKTREPEEIKQLLEPRMNNMFAEKEKHEFDYKVSRQLFDSLTERVPPEKVPTLDRDDARRMLKESAEIIYGRNNVFDLYTDFSIYSI